MSEAPELKAFALVLPKTVMAIVIKAIEAYPLPHATSSKILNEITTQLAVQVKQHKAKHAAKTEDADNTVEIVKATGKPRKTPSPRRK